jgi:hypothetical protein
VINKIVTLKHLTFLFYFLSHLILQYTSASVGKNASVYRINAYGKRLVTFDGLTQTQVASIGGPYNEYATSKEVQLLDTIEPHRITLIGKILLDEVTGSPKYVPLSK